MPTGAKLIGGAVFFVIGWMAALQALQTLPEGTPARYFPLTIALIGLWQGWWIMGGRAGAGFATALSNGVRTSVQMAMLGLIFFALRTMFMRSAGLRYDSPGEATFAAMELFLEYLLQSLTPGVWGTLLLGGLVGGFVTELAARAWR